MRMTYTTLQLWLRRNLGHRNPQFCWHSAGNCQTQPTLSEFVGLIKNSWNDFIADNPGSLCPLKTIHKRAQVWFLPSKFGEFSHWSPIIGLLCSFLGSPLRLLFWRSTNNDKTVKWGRSTFRSLLMIQRTLFQTLFLGLSVRPRWTRKLLLYSRGLKQK